MDVDLIVVGSGAGGLATAIVAHDLGLKVLVVEKTSLVGGTSAASGGGLWVPCNHLMAGVGAADSYEEAFTYMRTVVGPLVEDGLIDAYLRAAPKMAEYLDKHSDLKFSGVPLPDYRPEEPGAKGAYRNIEAVALDARRLGSDLKVMRRPHPQIDTLLTLTTNEVRPVISHVPGANKVMLRELRKYLLDFPWRFHTTRSRRLTFGNALIGGLLLSVRARNIELWTDAPMVHLDTENGKVVGASIHRGDRDVAVSAKGVVIAAGGFSSDGEMREKYMPHSHNPKWTVAPFDALTGDGIKEGMRLGAATRLMDEAWWIPSYLMANGEPTRGVFLERSQPGSIIVDQNAQRYFNESLNYDDAGRAMVDAVKAGRPASPSYFIFDARFRKNYLSGPMLPGSVNPDWMVAKDIWSVVAKAPTLEALATKLGLDPTALRATVERHNDFARSGKDEDFGRGDGIYDRFYCDVTISPNPNLAPLTQAPYYGIPIYPGDLGTKGGLVTDAKAWVLDQSGDVIEGLYAIGNSAASVMGTAYPGGGATIGASMTFGFVAAQHLAGREVRI